MASTWTDNHVGSDDVTLEVTAEDDDGPFLSLTDGGGVDLLITNDFEAQTFFDDVARAKADWDRMRA